jgi:hypothetical protein
MGNKIPLRLDDKELSRLGNNISKKTYEFFIKQIEKELLRGYYDDMDLNVFVTLFNVSIVNSNGNLLKWLAGFIQNVTNKDPEIEKLKIYFKKELDICFNTIIGKN